MGRLIKKIALFSIPVLLWMCFVIALDPFNRIQWSAAFSNETKEEKIKPINSVLFNMSEYRNNPTPVVFIGDSRTKALPASLYTQQTGLPSFNLHSNAAKLNEMVELFWFASRQTKLQKVYLGVNFNLYNQYAYANRIEGSEALLQNPLLYMFNRSVAESCFILAGMKAMKNHEPEMGREDFWKYNIETKAVHFYGKYQYPEKLFGELDSMAAYCRQNAIELTFLILPHHAEMRSRVADFGLTAEEIRFKSDMAKLAPTIDYDYPNEITSNREQFGDPIHYKSAIGELIVRELATDSLKIGRRISK
ncbi:MAG: hypothetical protein ACKVOK_14455 [Flavobacteriales bacterium]